MRAKGRVRVIVVKVSEIQSLVGSAKWDFYNDRSQSSFTEGQEKLEKAFALCLEITGMYDPVELVEKAVEAEDKPCQGDAYLEGIMKRGEGQCQ